MGRYPVTWRENSVQFLYQSVCQQQRADGRKLLINIYYNNNNNTNNNSRTVKKKSVDYYSEL
jgi:hypothetical protein